MKCQSLQKCFWPSRQTLGEPTWYLKHFFTGHFSDALQYCIILEEKRPTVLTIILTVQIPIQAVVKLQLNLQYFQKNGFTKMECR